MAFNNRTESTGGGSGITAANFVGIVQPSGAIDGLNTVFTLPNIPDVVNFVLVFLGGAFQTDGGEDYTRVGTTITFVNPPPLTSVMRVLYLRGPLSSAIFVGITTPTGAVDGFNNTFTVASIPDTVNFVLLFLNGSFQTDGGVDYTRTGLSFVFVTPPPLTSVLRVLFLQ